MVNIRVTKHCDILTTCLIEKGNNLTSFKYTWHNGINGNKFLRLDIYNTIDEIHFKSDNSYKKIYQ